MLRTSVGPRCVPRPTLHACALRPSLPQMRRGYAKGGGDSPDWMSDEPEPWADEEREKKRQVAAKKKKAKETIQRPPPKPKTQRRLEKEAEANLAYRTLEIAPGEEKNFNLVATTMLLRKPIIFPALTKWETQWYALQEKRHKEEARRVNPFKKGVEEPPDIPKNLRPGDRITAADRANDRRTTDRRLDQFLFLLVKKNRANHAWQFPRIAVSEGGLMRQTTQAAVKGMLGEGPLVFFDTNAPCAHYFYRYAEPHKSGKQGAMEFFYRAELIKGNPAEVKGEGIVDFAWAAPDEIPQYFSPELYRAVADSLPPILGAKEDPTFNLVPPPERKPGSASAGKPSTKPAPKPAAKPAPAAPLAAPAAPGSASAPQPAK